MKIYTAKVVDNSGKKSVISEEAISRQLFEESLNTRGYFIIEIKESDKKRQLIFSDTIKKSFLTEFTYNVYSLLDFGIDINEVFNILKDIYTKGKEGDFINEVISSLKKGEKLSTAIKSAKSGEIFDNFYITMVSSGEHSGNLKEAFRLIYAYIKNNNKVKEKLVSSSIYPLAILLVSVLAVHLLFFLIIPNFMKIYDTMDYTPSQLIGSMFAVSNFLLNNAMAYFIVLFLVIFGIAIYFRTKASNKLISFFLQKAPLVSRVYKLQSKIRISFSLEILIKGGVTLEDALKKLSDVEPNQLVKAEYEKALITLKEGGKVGEAFKNIKAYSSRDLNIIEIADSISRTDEGFEKIHVDAEQVLESFLDSIFKLIEPVIMIFIGLFISFVMYLVLSPTLNMMDMMDNF